MKSQRADHEGSQSQDSTLQSAKKKSMNRTAKTPSMKKEDGNNPERLAGSKKRASAKSWQSQQGVALSEADVETHIAKRAYELYEQRGWQHGHDLEDWTQAAREVVGQEHAK